MLVACAGAQPPIGAPGATQQSRASTTYTARGGSTGTARQDANEPFLYVAGHKISTYTLGGSAPLHSSRPTYYVLRARIALDAHGNLCESNGNPSYEQTLAYNARTLKLVGGLDNAGDFQALVADRSGYLYGAGGRGVVVFAPGCTDLINTIRRCADSVDSLAFDSSGDLYAANYDTERGSVCVYAPARKPGHMKFVRMIRQGLNGADALAIGSTGELFVANYGSSSVCVFAAGGSKPMLRITNGINSPKALAVDSKGRLYVINRPYSPPSAAAWLVVYKPGGTRPVRKIAGNNVNPQAIALDSSDNLYVANATATGGDVAVYSPGGKKLLRVIRKGVDNPPMALLIGSPSR